MQNNPVLENIFERRSIRSYETTPVDEQRLNLVLEAGIWAPSASNYQTWHFTVVTDPHVIDEINAEGKAFMARSEKESARKRGQDPDAHIFYHAPCVILVSYELSHSWAKIDTALAAQNIMLSAHALGLGTCYIGLFTPWLESEDARDYLKKFPIPEGYAPLHFITLGIPASQTPKRPRREGTVSYM